MDKDEDKRSEESPSCWVNPVAACTSAAATRRRQQRWAALGGAPELRVDVWHYVSPLRKQQRPGCVHVEAVQREGLKALGACTGRQGEGREGEVEESGTSGIRMIRAGRQISLKEGRSTHR